ncbi:MAG: spore maturation protein [Candidatus Melainabacteria bacterium RIFOXYA12_FULL_32_12]|nr:MAG: spore maturation protein [Candidatus Melainabacteria bacterium GWF2_32_7]OGI18093.1 MAG: spore maturation protein [Candidatus Melainabacteria bacterium RIFOXYA2_FULL_32_9]OGI24867.1 MAG: spore maturation protein [Candidatus Melainabacteria bacterium RIFOXYA12_FULL_32_12]
MKEIMGLLSAWAIPLMLLLIPLWAVYRKVPLYETFIDGAKEGFSVGVKIIPYLVAILVAIGMFRASGAIDIIAQVFSPALGLIGMPADILPLAIIRPLSGSGALGIMTEIANQYGGDAYISRLAAVMVGSSETTFYVLAVYFGSVGIKNFRHAVAAGLIADIAGMLAALFICQLVF